MSRRNQLLWAGALYATFAAVEFVHIGAGDWSHPVIVTILAIASAALIVTFRRVRRSQPVTA
jgi:hypothetical protein